jgi:hypothetical protein
VGTLYYGDNFDILLRHFKDESVDLVNLAPPFNSAQNYNAFIEEKDGSAAASAGFCEHKTNNRGFPCPQPRTAGELTEGKRMERPTGAANSDESFKETTAAEHAFGQSELNP